MVTLVAGACARALVQGDGQILLLDQAGGGGDTVGSTARVVVPATAPRRGKFIRGGHGGVKRGEITHHALVLVLFVSVDGLRVLTKVVETRKLFATVAAKGAFPGMFPRRHGIKNQGERRREESAYLMWRARCSLLEKTMRHSP